MFSKSCEYGLQAMIYISMHSNSKNKVTLKQIAKSQQIPQPFLSKILQQLVKHKLIGSMKGRNGGFYLLKSPQKITLLEIVKIINGTDLLDGCVLGLSKCSAQNPCPVYYEFKKVKDQIKQILKSKSLNTLSEDILARSGGAYYNSISKS